MIGQGGKPFHKQILLLLGSVVIAYSQEPLKYLALIGYMINSDIPAVKNGLYVINIDSKSRLKPKLTILEFFVVLNS